MKKASLLIAILALAGYGFAQQTLIYDSFEEYTVGNKLSTEANAAGHSWWTTYSAIWNQQSVNDEDGVVSGDYASNGAKSAYISNLNDMVLLLGSQTEGDFELSFDVYTPAGQHGYFNLGKPRNSYPLWQYELQVYINAKYNNGSFSHSPGHGSVFTGDYNSHMLADLPCVEDEWMNFTIQYDAGNHQTELYFNNELVCTTWLDFDAVDFCSNANIFYSGFYLDNVSLVRRDVFPVAEFTITPESIEETMGLNQEKTVEITMNNSGDAVGHWAANIEFEEGVPTSWAAIDKIDGAIPAGETDYITLTLNTAGLTASRYESRLSVMTSSRERTLVEIPIVLNLKNYAVSESSSPMVNLYPNPAHSVVTLEGEKLGTVSIYNAVGQLVRTEALNDGTNTLELCLEDGVYFFRVDDNNGNHTVQRVVVVR